MNAVQAFYNKQYGLATECSYDFALRRLCVAKEDSWRGITPSNYSSDYNPEPPIFSAKFANCDGYRHMLAIANEDGKIALQDTTVRNYEADEKALSAPQCHYNAVFDLEWAPGQMKFVSASGDHTAHLWQVDGAEIRSVRAFTGHTRSVKTAAFRRNDATVFATGGRDGAIVIWDTRAKLNVDSTPRADNCIYSGHVGGPCTPVSQRKRTRTPKMPTHTSAASSSITGLAFQDANTLISCGAGDGVIKVWDLRRNYTAYKKEPLPKHSLPYAGSSTFKGFTNLVIDEAGSRLYANCMDNTIYCYNLYSYAARPLAQYRGFYNSTFYIKSCLSPDGKYLLSGSSDERAYIWSLGHAAEPLVALAGHAVEVTCVAWGATHDRPIVTCSDDARHMIWRIGPELVAAGAEADYRGQAHFVRRFGECQRKGVAAATAACHNYNLRDLESTPRSLRRLVEQNERTPGSMEKVSLKRSFLDMLGGAEAHEDGGGGGGGVGDDEQRETKRPKMLETKGRRLFSPAHSNSTTAGFGASGSPQRVRCLSVQFANAAAAVGETTTSPSPCENTSPVSRKRPHNGDCCANAVAADDDGLSPMPGVSRKMQRRNEQSPSDALTAQYTSPPANAIATTAAAAAASGTALSASAIPLGSVIFSPTSNLPNYVVDGDAPHLGIMSPKRKHKDAVDWLTKMRKQKLMSCRGGGATLTDKIGEEHGGLERVASPRVQSLRNGEHKSPSCGSPRRRVSHSACAEGGVCSSPTASGRTIASATPTAPPRTPTTSRRNSETTLLRFFSVQTTTQAPTPRSTSSLSAISNSDVDGDADGNGAGGDAASHNHSHSQSEVASVTATTMSTSSSAAAAVGGE